MNQEQLSLREEAETKKNAQWNDRRKSNYLASDDFFWYITHYEK